MEKQRTLILLDTLLRLLALCSTLSAAIVMGTDKQTKNTIIGSFSAKYRYSPSFLFFVVVNAVACGYSALSMISNIVNNIKSLSLSRFNILFIQFFLDLIMVAFVSSGASAATAVAYLGKKGNSHTGWHEICHHFDRFCDHVAGALVPSFVSVIIFMVLTVMSTYRLYKASN
eukprot:Gb_26813 [translate_table: standard]